jgi:hypothetical protein
LQGEKTTKTALTKQAFGVPSIETASRIDNSDRVSALHAAGYRYDARLRETAFAEEIGNINFREDS